MSLLTLTGNLSWLYTSDIKRLWLRAFLIFMIRTIAASIWYWRSWKTLSVVLACSSTWNKSRGSNENPNARNSKETQGQIQTVSFIWIWFILILKSLCLKSLLHENLSPSSTSLLFGILVSTRAFPQASDCRVRRSSLSSAKRTEMQRWDQGALRHELLMNLVEKTGMWSHAPIPVASLISSRVNSSPSLNISSTSVWKSDTCNSFLPFCGRIKNKNSKLKTRAYLHWLRGKKNNTRAMSGMIHLPL